MFFNRQIVLIHNFFAQKNGQKFVECYVLYFSHDYSLGFLKITFF